MRLNLTAALVAITMTASSAFGGFMITQTATPGGPLPGPYITFDEPGVPVGVSQDPQNFYLASDDVSFASNSGFLVIEDWDSIDGIDGGMGSGNSIQGGFGVRINFPLDVDALTFQGWAAGSPAPPFGGINVFVLNNGNQVASYSGISPFGGVGDTWFNVRADSGDVFDEVVFFNGAFNSFSSYVDNVNFSIVPEPTTLALGMLASLAGLGLRRRR